MTLDPCTTTAVAAAIFEMQRLFQNYTVLKIGCDQKGDFLKLTIRLTKIFTPGKYIVEYRNWNLTW